jgi:cell wall-associated NlpC family hydrolase
VRVPRTLLALLACVLVLGLIGVAMASGSDATTSGGGPLAINPASSQTDTLSVPAVSDAVLAEMTRRQGTPRRVRIEARRHARRLARLGAQLRAHQAAAAAAAAPAARQAAARRTASRPSYWFDSQAATVANTNPSSAAESAWLQGGRGGWVEGDGFARAPANAPAAIKGVVQAGNQIARSPYLWGGGHGAWQDRGYDCSGSVSYALAAGGMLGYTQTSGQLMNWGVPGPGRWLTIYASQSHVFMYVAGMRFDTSGRTGDRSSRWQLANRSADGFAARHYPGL